LLTQKLRENGGKLFVSHTHTLSLSLFLQLAAASSENGYFCTGVCSISTYKCFIYRDENMTTYVYVGLVLFFRDAYTYIVVKYLCL